MKKNKKILMLIVCFCVSILMLTGCSSVSYGLVQYSNGQILQSFSIVLDEEELSNNGYDLNETEIELRSILSDLKDDLNSDFQTRMVNKNALDVYLQVMQGINHSITYERNVVTMQILFKNVTCYRYYYGLLDEENTNDNNNLVVTDCGFYNIITTKTYTKFYNYRENPIYLNAENKVKEYFNGSNFTIQDVNFNYCYGLPSSSKYKSNADYIYSQDGIDIHIWNLGSDNLNKEIEFYQIQVKPLLWYVLAVVLTLILMVILVIVCLIKNKFHKNKSDSNDKEIDKMIDDYINFRLNSGVNDNHIVEEDNMNNNSEG